MTSTPIEYFNSGLNVLPIRKDKRPACKGWKEIQESRQTETCFQEYFSKRSFGVAVVTGFADREAIDIDTKYDVSGDLVEQYNRLVDEHAPGLWDRLTEVQTMSGGLHLIYRCEEVEGNQKLALRPRTSDELSANPKATQPIVLIETRGRGGYVAAPPTPGYKVIRGDYTNPEWINPDERSILLNCARFLDQVEEVEFEASDHQKATGDWDGTSVWDDYNQKHSCLELLTKHGWKEVRTSRNITHLRRPHAPGENPAPTSGHIKNDEDVFFCWSTSTSFKTRLPYKPYDIYCLLEHQNNKKAAAKALYGAGYGARQKAGNRAEYIERIAERERERVGRNGYHGDKDSAAEAAIKILKHEGISGEDVVGIVSEVMQQPPKSRIKISSGLYEKDGRYQRIKEESSTDVTNFTMEGLYLVKGSRPARIIHFKSVTGEAETIAVPIDQLTSDSLSKLIKGIGNLSAKWTKNQFEDILLHASRNQRKAETAEYLGHYEDGKVFLFANGAICYQDNKFYPVNEHGIAEAPTGCYHIPQYKNEGEPMTYKEGEINFRKYLDLMADAYGLNGQTGAAGVLAYAFSDILFRETGNIFLLFLAGKRETGKTSFADCVRAPFYFKKPATLNMKSSSTVKSRYRMLAKYSNGVVVFDEFEDIPKNTNVVVTSYNRDGYSRAATSNDNEVLETPVRANSLFIGNYLPESEPAAMSRLIILPFRKDDKEQKSLEAYRKLTDLLRRGTGGMLRQILSLRQKMESEYSREFASYMACESLTQHVKDIRDAEKVAAIMATLKICGTELGVEFEEMEQIEQFLMRQLKDQKSLVDSTDHTSQFFTEVALLIDEGTLVDGKHYAVSPDNTEVVFKFSACYREAQKSAVTQRRILAGKQMLKRLLMENEAFVPGSDSANYRVRRSGLLGMCFALEALPDEIKDTFLPNSAPDGVEEEVEAEELPF